MNDHSDGETGADRAPVRPVWRILVFAAFLFFFAGVGGTMAAFVPATSWNWGPLIASTLATVLAGWVTLRWLDRRPAVALGLPPGRFAFIETTTGTAIGAAILAVAAALIVVPGGLVFTGDSGTMGEYAAFLLLTLVYFGIAAAFEEALFRGYPFQVLVEWIGVWPAVLIGSILFAIVHGQNPNVTPLAILNIFLAGVMLSIAYLRTLSLWFATGVHLGWNWMMASVLALPVSGLEFDTPLYDAVPVGAPLWNGGDFGPEGGIASTVILLLAIVGLLRWKRLAPAPVTLAARPLAEPMVRRSGLL